MDRATGTPLQGVRLAPRPTYLALMLTAVQRAISYRVGTLLALLAGLIWVAMLYALWRTVFAARPVVAGFSWRDMQTYVILAFVLDRLLPFQTIGRMTAPVRTGLIAIDLLRPVGYLPTQLAQCVGHSLVEGVLGGAVIWVLSMVVLGIALPVSPLLAALCALSITLGYLTKFLLCFHVALICFRTINPLGLVWMFTAITGLLSGTLVPLQFFPEALHTLALASPFGGIVNTPLQLYLGHLQGAAIVAALGIQLMWIAILWLSARLLWSWSARGLEIQGG